LGLVSTWIGDLLGTPGAVSSLTSISRREWTMLLFHLRKKLEKGQMKEEMDKRGV